MEGEYVPEEYAQEENPLDGIGNEEGIIDEEGQEYIQGPEDIGEIYPTDEGQEEGQEYQRQEEGQEEYDNFNLPYDRTDNYLDVDCKIFINITN